MKQVVKSEKSAKALGPYSAGIAIDSFVFLSGQLGIDQNGDLVSDNVVEQTKQAFVNIKNLLESQGLTYYDIIKTTVFLSNIEDFGKVN